MKIIADSSSLYSTKEANSKGFTILPVAVTLNGKSYKDYDEITSDKLLSQIVQGAIPKSSQPAIGEILDTFTSTDEEIVINAFTVYSSDGILSVGGETVLHLQHRIF